MKNKTIYLKKFLTIVLMNFSLLVYSFTNNSLSVFISIILAVIALALILHWGVQSRPRKYADGDSFLWSVKILLGIIVVIASYLIMYNHVVTADGILLSSMIMNTGILSIVFCKSSSIIPPIFIVFMCTLIGKYNSIIVELSAVVIALFYVFSIPCISIECRMSLKSVFVVNRRKKIKLRATGLNGTKHDFYEFWQENRDRIIAVTIENSNPLIFYYKCDEESVLIDYRLSDGSFLSIINQVNIGKFNYLKAIKKARKMRKDEIDDLINYADELLSRDDYFVKCSNLGFRIIKGYKRKQTSLRSTDDNNCY